MPQIPRAGDFVRIRSRRWLVEDGAVVSGVSSVRLACIDDDAQGETVSVLWDAELDPQGLRSGNGLGPGPRCGRKFPTTRTWSKSAGRSASDWSRRGGRGGERADELASAVAISLGD